MYRIAIITNTFPPEFGAAPGRLADMATSLSNRGHEVVVLTGVPNYPKASIDPTYRKQWLQQETQEKVRIRRHWMAAYRGKGKLGRLKQMLSLGISMLRSIPFLYKFRPRFILVQYPPVVLPLLAIALSKITKAKLITNFSDLWPQAMLDLGVIAENSISHRALQVIEKLVFKHSHAFLAQSDEVYQHLPAQKPKLLYRTGVNVELFSPAAIRNLQGQKLRLVYAGVLGMAHGMLEICQRIRWAELPAELHIYGDGLDRPAIEKWIEQHPGLPIILHKAVPPKEIPRMLLGYDAILIPQKVRIRGTVPSKIYEAMAIGLPIIFMGGGEGKALIRSFQCGLTVAPGNFNSLEKAICQLHNLPVHHRAQLGKAGREAAIGHFDRQQITASLLKWIDGL